MSRSFGLAVVLALLVVSPAQAVPRYAIGRGEAPGVAVDGAGTAHIAFNGEYANGEPVMYCAVPRGARKCAPRPILIDGESALAQPALVHLGPAPGEVWVTSVRQSNVLAALHSLDSGATWSGPIPIGDGRYFEGAFGPNGQIAFTFRQEFRLRSLGGAPATGVGEINANWPQGNSKVAWFGPRPVVVTGGASRGFAVSSWTGTGDINNQASWSGPFRIGSSNYFELASGPRGLWMLHERSLRTADDAMYTRKFNGRTFGRAHRISAGRLGATPIVGDGFGQGPTGRMAAVWYASVRERFEYSVSKTGRRSTPARVLARGLELPFQIRVALGPDGRGVVVWDENGGDDINVVRISAARAR